MFPMEMIVKGKIAHFIEQIKKLAIDRQSYKLSNKSGGFPIFFENSTYNEQSYFEERIENAIWKTLVNGVFNEMFNDEYCIKHNISIKWIDMYPQGTFSYVEKIEEIYPLEFVVISEGKRTGYRYTNCYWREEQMDTIFYNYNLDALRVIDFSSDKISAFMHPLIVSAKYSAFVKKMTLREFFDEFFSEEDYRIYLSNIQTAVSEVNKYVGLQSVSNLTRQHLPYFIKDISKDLSISDLSSQTYIIFNQNKLKKELKRSLMNSDNHFTAEDYKVFDRLFYDERRYLALCGKESFAHSFITSEYLYRTLGDNNEFDYTAIVTGYLKSIEQLLYRVELFLLKNIPKEQLWIKANYYDKNKANEYIDGQKIEKNRSKKHIKFKSDNKKYFDTSFTPLVNLIGDYESGWAISKGGQNLITTYLKIFCSECRNEHFHKDNINDPKEVGIIRNNTFLLFYYVLGGLRFYGNIEKDYQVLGIVNRSFENMYHAIIKQSNGGDYFIITFAGNPSFLTAFPINHGVPEYDENGFMINPSLRFVRIDRDVNDDWHKDNWGIIEDNQSKSSIYLTPDNMPVKIQYIDKISGKRVDIEW